MTTTICIYPAAALSLLTASVIAAAPVTDPSSLSVSHANVRLTADPDYDAMFGHQLNDVVTKVADTLGLGGLYQQAGIDHFLQNWDYISPLNEVVDQLGKDVNFFDWGATMSSGQWLLNVPENFVIDLLNIPYNLFTAEARYAAGGLGYPGVIGSSGTAPDAPYDAQHPIGPNMEPGVAMGPIGSQGDPAPAPYYAPIGPDHEWTPVGFGGTGSWWMESTGNTWGWDEGNFGQVIGLSNVFVPIPQFSTPFAYELQAAAMPEIVANPQACPFECTSLLSYLGRWFNVPLQNLITGVAVGRNYQPLDPPLGPLGGDVVHGQEADGSNFDTPIEPMGQALSWDGQTVQFDPLFPLTSFFYSLTMDPQTSGNGFDQLIANYEWLLSDPWNTMVMPWAHWAEDMFNDFFPLMPGSFVYWGAPSLYTVAPLLAGLLSSVTGIANPFAAYTLAPGGAFTLGPYVDSPNIGADGAPIDLHDIFPNLPADYTTHLIGPSDLLPGLGAGVLNLVGGLLGYLDPDTYLHGFALTVATLPDELAKLLPGVDLGWLANGLIGWHNGIGETIAELAGWSNELTGGWYAPLTVGMDGLINFTDVPLP